MAITLNGTTGITTPALDSSGPLTSLGIDDNATSTAITIDASNNVGIGTSSPAFKLDVAGSAHATSLTTSGTPSGSFGASKWFTQQEGVGISRTYFCGPDASTRSTWEIYNATSTGAPRLAAGFTPTYTYFNIPSGTTTALVIDSAGRVTMPYQPAASASYNGSNLGPTNVIPLNKVQISRGGITISGNRFTVPIGGTYMIGYHNLATATGTQVTTNHNGSSINSGAGSHTQAIGGGENNFSVQNLVSLSANDYIEFILSSGVLHGNWNYNRFYIFLLG